MDTINTLLEESKDKTSSLVLHVETFSMATTFLISMATTLLSSRTMDPRSGIKMRREPFLPIWYQCLGHRPQAPRAPRTTSSILSSHYSDDQQQPTTILLPSLYSLVSRSFPWCTLFFVVHQDQTAAVVVAAVVCLALVLVASGKLTTNANTKTSAKSKKTSSAKGSVSKLNSM